MIFVFFLEEGNHFHCGKMKKTAQYASELGLCEGDGWAFE
jgi:hypothetical protein